LGDLLLFKVCSYLKFFFISSFFLFFSLPETVIGGCSLMALRAVGWDSGSLVVVVVRAIAVVVDPLVVVGHRLKPPVLMVVGRGVPLILLITKGWLSCYC